MAERVLTATTTGAAAGRRAGETTAGRVRNAPAPPVVGLSPGRVRRLLCLDRPDPAWVDAAPFRAHLRHLMSVGQLDVAEVAVVLGLSTSVVRTMLDGRDGRWPRRVSPEVARRLLLVSAADVRGLRWCLAPAGPARLALARLLAGGWSGDEVALAVGFRAADLDGLTSARHCNRLLGVRLVGLARSLPGTIDDQDLVPAAAA